MWKDLTGQRFGKLVVIKRAKEVLRSSTGNSQGYPWETVCECGNSYLALNCHLLNGSVSSCGCSAIAQVKHGQSNTLLYGIWEQIVERCYREKHGSYHRYGGRGIRVCDRWRHDFAAFAEDIGPRPSPKHTVDRINNNGNYEPGNIRWATRKEQQRNMRSNVLIEHEGKTLTAGAWEEITGIKQKTISDRYLRGMRGKELFVKGHPPRLAHKRLAIGLPASVGRKTSNA